MAPRASCTLPGRDHRPRPDQLDEAYVEACTEAIQGIRESHWSHKRRCGVGGGTHASREVLDRQATSPTSMPGGRA